MIWSEKYQYKAKEIWKKQEPRPTKERKSKKERKIS